jgi:hypothetical protein
MGFSWQWFSLQQVATATREGDRVRLLRPLFAADPHSGCSATPLETRFSSIKFALSPL